MIFERLLDIRSIWDRSRLLLLFDLGRLIGFKSWDALEARCIVYCNDMLTLDGSRTDSSKY